MKFGSSYILPDPLPPVNHAREVKTDENLDDWVIVPTNSTLTIHKQAVMIHPIVDEYYNPNPSYTRSTGFAVSKGLDATEAKERGG